MSQLSVIIPVLNGERFLQQALDSIPRDLDVEVLVVDDGSTDSSVELARAAGARVLAAEGPASGPAAARNRALRVVQSPLVAFLDADDWWPEGSLQFRLEVLRENPELDLVQGQIESRESGELAEAVARRRLPVPSFNVNLGACLFRKEILDRVGPFDESLRFGEDGDLFMRLWEVDAVKRFLLRTCLYYRLHQSNMTVEGPQDMLTNLKLLKRHKDRMQDRLAEKKVPWGHFVGWTAPDLGQDQQFTHDSISMRVPQWKEWFGRFRGAPELAILELGSSEGQATDWFLNWLCTHPSARLTCVDLFQDQREAARFDRNLAEPTSQGRLQKVSADRHRWLAAQEARPTYDLIYLHAPQRASDFLVEVMLGWRLLRLGGCMLLDDYLWHYGEESLERPQLAIDLLLAANLEGLKLVYRGYQVLVSKGDE